MQLVMFFSPSLAPSQQQPVIKTCSVTMTLSEIWVNTRSALSQVKKANFPFLLLSPRSPILWKYCSYFEVDVGHLDGKAVQPQTCKKCANKSLAPKRTTVDGFTADHVHMGHKFQTMHPPHLCPQTLRCPGKLHT